jgi:hypothetical protein
MPTPPFACGLIRRSTPRHFAFTKCPICDKNISNTAFDAHREVCYTRRVSPRKPKRCPVCNRKYRTAFSVQAHLEKVHMPEYFHLLPAHRQKEIKEYRRRLAKRPVRVEAKPVSIEEKRRKVVDLISPK